VLLAIRGDHYGHLAEYPAVAELLTPNHVLVIDDERGARAIDRAPARRSDSGWNLRWSTPSSRRSRTNRGLPPCRPRRAVGDARERLIGWRRAAHRSVKEPCAFG
jgi:hypothetical protein